MGISQGRFHFSVIGSTYHIAVQRFSAQETISQCYNVELWLVSEDRILPADVMEKEGRFAGSIETMSQQSGKSSVQRVVSSVL